MSNLSKAAVDDRLFEKHEYHALTPDHKNTLMLKRLKHGHFGKVHGGNGNGTGRSSGEGRRIKSFTRSITALTKKINKFILCDDDDDDDDESSDEEECT
jgi:hypothetical protein